MKITTKQLEESMLKNGHEVQYLPFTVKPNVERRPHTVGSIRLEDIVKAINAIPGIAMIETMQLIGVKGGKEEDLGEAPLSNELKAREICRQYGEDPDDDDSMIMGALMELINWQNTQMVEEALNEPAESDKIDPAHEFYRERAFDTRHKDGDIEFDADAEVSLGDDAGAYVQAWVWIPGEPPVDSEGGDCD
jgi:hypothetical protein